MLERFYKLLFRKRDMMLGITGLALTKRDALMIGYYLV
jgi:hypothetical protein